jgi:hypothetical protein
LGNLSYNFRLVISILAKEPHNMQTKTPGKLALTQEVVRNLTENEKFQAGHFSHTCPPSVGFPACTPALGAK